MRIVRISVTICVILLLAAAAQAQSPAETVVEGAYWQHRATLFRSLPNPAGEICFLGDSITDGCEWRELTGIESVTNRGISGDTTWGIMARIEEVYEGTPAKIFLMIGTNDLAWGGKRPPEVLAKVREILDTLQRETPDTKIYVQSVFPVNDAMRDDQFDNADIDEFNPMLERLARERGVTWIDIRPVLSDADGQLKRELTSDGLHLNGQAYYLWYSAIRRYLEE